MGVSRSNEINYVYVQRDFDKKEIVILSKFIKLKENGVVLNKKYPSINFPKKAKNELVLNRVRNKKGFSSNGKAIIVEKKILKFRILFLSFGILNFKTLVATIKLDSKKP